MAAKKQVEEVEQVDPFEGVEGEHDEFWDGEAGWTNASAVIWQPEVGSLLMGVYDGNEPFTEGKKDIKEAALKHFIIEWNTKTRYSFVGGQVFDKTMSDAKIQKGYKVKVKYLGQKDTTGGKRVNLFDIKYRS